MKVAFLASKSARFRGAKDDYSLLFARLMTDDLALDHVDHILGHIGRHVGQALEVL